MRSLLRQYPTAMVAAFVLLLAGAMSGGAVATPGPTSPAIAGKAATAGDAEAAAAVKRFYTAYLLHKPAGLPDGDDLARLRPFLSRRLAGLIDAALDYQRAWARSHPDDKPPFVDGDHFSSLFEGPTRFEVLRGEAAPQGTWSVRVRFFHDAATPSWEDTVVIVREGDAYRVDDVIFSGAGEFNPPGRLSERLRERDGG